MEIFQKIIKFYHSRLSLSKHEKYCNFFDYINVAIICVKIIISDTNTFIVVHLIILITQDYFNYEKQSAYFHMNEQSLTYNIIKMTQF